MRSWASDDGGYFPLGAFDVAHATTCVPATIGPLTGRCVPADLPVRVDTAVFYPHPADYIFSDSNCLTLVSPRSGCAGETPFATDATTHCRLDAIWTPIEPTAVVPLSRTTVPLFVVQGVGSQRTCVPFQPSPAPVSITRGAALDPTTLPTLTASHDAGTDRLLSLSYVSSTGGRLQTTGLLTASLVTYPRLYDSTLGESCHAQRVSAAGQPEEYRCLPDTLTVDGALYTDAGCSKLGYRVPKGQSCIAAAPRYVTLDSVDVDRAWKAGAPVATATIYEKYFDGSCHPSTLSGIVSDYDWYETTAVDMSTFPEVRFVTE
jgi:hypothetical protein